MAATLPTYDKINADPFGAQLALCDALRDALRVANHLDGDHAIQYDVDGDEDNGTYGMIAKALLKALTITLRNEGFEDAEVIATVLYDHAIDNGEDITYQYGLFVQGVITVY